jgi:hypothetical protein
MEDEEDVNRGGRLIEGATIARNRRRQVCISQWGDREVVVMRIATVIVVGVGVGVGGGGDVEEEEKRRQ